MSMKIKVSYEREEEASQIIDLLKPIIDRFKVKKSTGTPPYNHLYFTPKNSGKPHQ